MSTRRAPSRTRSPYNQVELYEAMKTPSGFGFHRTVKRRQMHLAENHDIKVVNHAGTVKTLHSDEEMRDLFMTASSKGIIVWVVDEQGISHYSDDPGVDLSAINFLPFVYVD